MRVTLLGVGLMGRAMAERLQASGHGVTVWNRSRGKLAGLPPGIRLADRPAEAVQGAEVVLLMLAHAAAIEQVLLDPETRPHLRDRTVIQMGTIAPRESRRLQQQVAAAGADYLEAPVLGSIPEVQGGTLFVMIGGTPEQFERWRGFLHAFGPEPRLIGAVGRAAALKLALNQLIASETAAFALSLGLVRRAGVSVETFMTILRGSALYAPTFDKKLSRMLARDFSDPNFPTKHLLKDVRLFLDEAEAQGLETSSLRGLPGLLEKALTQGLSELDYSALYNVVDPG